MKLRLIMKMQRRQSRRGGEDLIHRFLKKSLKEAMEEIAER